MESVTLSIYGEQSGGTPLWQETQNVTLDAEGRYTALMGSTRTEGMPLDLFTSGEPRWLGVQFNRPGEAEQPRVPLVSVPYALKASDAETLGGRPAAAYLLAPSAVTPDSTGTAAGEASAPNTPSAPASKLKPRATSGTTNCIGLFTNVTDLGCSLMWQVGGNLGLGTQNPSPLNASAIQPKLVLTGTGVAQGIQVVRTVSPGAGGAQMIISSTRGSDANTYTALQNGDGIGIFSFNGTDGAKFVPAAGVYAQVDGAVSTNNVPGRILFTTSSGGANNLLERMRITSGGNVGIGTTTPGYTLDVAGVINGNNPATSGYANGVQGTSSSPNGAGVSGFNSNTSGTGYPLGVSGSVIGSTGAGVAGSANLAGAVGISGYNNATSGYAVGVAGGTASNSGTGVAGNASQAGAFGVDGFNSATTGFAVGVQGNTSSTSGAGVRGGASNAGAVGVQGNNNATSGFAVGVAGNTSSNQGAGVSGNASHAGAAGVSGFNSDTTGFAVGVQGGTASIAGVGVQGNANATSGYAVGVNGFTASNSGAGVQGIANIAGAVGVNGINNATSGYALGVQGTTASTNGAGVLGVASQVGAAGVEGDNTATSGGFAYGVAGTIANTNGAGVFGYASQSGSMDSPVGGVLGYSATASGYAFGTGGVAISPGGVGIVGASMGCPSNTCTLVAGTAGQFWAATTGVLLQGLSGAAGAAPDTMTQVFKVDGQGNLTAAGVALANVSGAPVLVDSTGKLGIASSSRRYKEDIQDMGDTSSGLLNLRPVTFRYKKPFADGSQPIQYGLIAEEVAEVYPDLVARSADGQIETVKYQLLDSMLLNEVQKQQKEIGAQQGQIRQLQQQIEELKSLLSNSHAGSR